MKYSDHLAKWLREMGYSTCFFVGGGGCMHLVESFSRKMKAIPTVHEIAAGIAAEYFNVVAEGKEKALALVTSGPGLTNIVTAIAGAWYESRELLVIGGQVKTADLACNGIRQRGFFEACGTEIVRPITTASVLLKTTMERRRVAELINHSDIRRKGPVFLEIPLDIQAAEYEETPLDAEPDVNPVGFVIGKDDDRRIDEMISAIRSASRPVILLGGGVERTTAAQLAEAMASSGIPILTTFNGADRIDSRHPCYYGRTNTWGMRYSNLIFQQADCAIALGTRLGLQQTGFNWSEYLPNGRLYQVDIDRTETSKGHPVVHSAINCDANYVIRRIYAMGVTAPREWTEFCKEIKCCLPLNEASNKTALGHISPYQFYADLSQVMTEQDTLIPSSSGGFYTASYQSFCQKLGQHYISNKGMASMGYGLSGAIGAAVAAKGRRVVSVEGDGGFAQNIQEIGTVAINNMNIKMFVAENDGYSSIRMTQRNYFNGHYVGCDKATGLALPNWDKLFDVWGIRSIRIAPGFVTNEEFLSEFNRPGPSAFIIPVDPNQTYWPKISSKINPDGSMSSMPLHEMSPSLSDDERCRFMKYLNH